jgi:MarR family transcriptional regulator for hemolysin
MSAGDEDWAPMQHPGHYLSRISRGLTRIGDSRLRPLGLATAQLPVLSMLRNGERLSQAELAKMAKVEQPTMAQLLQRMERDGLICREPDPRDRRSSLVMLTDAAREKLPAGRQVLREGNTEMTRGLSADEVATFVGLLRRVLDNVEGMQPESATRNMAAS